MGERPEKLNLPSFKKSPSFSGLVSPRGSDGKMRLRLPGFMKKRKANSDVSVSQISDQEHKEVVISYQQVAVRSLALQQQCVEKRKQLYHLLLAIHRSSDEKQKKIFQAKVEEISAIVHEDEVMIGTLEHSIDAFRTNSENSCTVVEVPPTIDPTFKFKPVEVVTSPMELPPKFISDLQSAGLTDQDIEQHFELILIILRYTNRSLYMTQEQAKKYQETAIASSVICNYGRITKPLDHFLASVNSQVNPKKLYRFFAKEGKGGFGRVYFAKNKKTGKQVAIKKLKADCFKIRRESAIEISFLTYLSHQNIVSFENVYDVDGEIWIVMEYLDGGTIHKALKQTHLSESQMAFIADQMLLGLKYLHSNDIVHRDIKGDNVMMTVKGEIKIVDLGLCIDLTEYSPGSRGAGTLSWMAPEVIRTSRSGTPSDIWSFGMTLLEMALTYPPYNDNHILGLFKLLTETFEPVSEILKGGKWTEQFIHIIKVCLHPDPDRRPTAAQLLDHPWFYEQIQDDTEDEIVHLVDYCWAKQAAPVF